MQQDCRFEVMHPTVRQKCICILCAGADKEGSGMVNSMGSIPGGSNFRGWHDPLFFVAQGAQGCKNVSQSRAIVEATAIGQ